MSKSSPSDLLQKSQFKIWKQFSPNEQTWIMMANFLFAVVPGIIYLIRNVFIEDESIMHQASFKDAGYWTYLVIILIALLQSLFEIILYKRFMTPNLIKTNVFGQCIALLFVLSGASKNILDTLKLFVNSKMNDTPTQKNLKKLALFCILLAFTFMLFFAYRFSQFSEAT